MSRVSALWHHHPLRPAPPSASYWFKQVSLRPSSASPTSHLCPSSPSSPALAPPSFSPRRSSGPCAWGAGLCQGDATDSSRLSRRALWRQRRGKRATGPRPERRAARSPLRAPLPPRAKVVLAEGRTRGCGARAAVSAAGRASSAAAGWAEQREAEGAVAAAAIRVPVLSSSRRGRGRLLPPSFPPPSAAVPPPSAPRGFLQTSVRGAIP